MPRTPPPEQPIRTFPSPDIADQVVLEWVTSELAASAPVAPGTAHPNTREFSGFKFGKQVVNPADHNFFLRYYVKDQPSPDTFTPAWNYALKYSGQSNSHPVVIRAYRKTKAGYTPLAKGTALTDFAGAFLIEEEALQFPTDSEFFALYWNVIRVYETLPGPYIPFTRYDENLGPIQGRRRAVLNSGQATSLGATSKKTYEGRDGSSIVSWEIEENWSDGTGGAGNPAYPILKTDFYDDDRGAVHQTSQITTDTTTAGSLTAPSTTAIKTRFEPYQENPNLRKKIIETWTVPGPIQTSTEFERDGIRKISTRQMMKVASILTQETAAPEDGESIRKFHERLNEVLGFQIIETITVDDTSLLDLPSLTQSILNLIPEIFRGQIPTLVTSAIIQGTAEWTALDSGEFEHSERQLTPLYKEVRRTDLTYEGDLPLTISGIKETNDKKQVVPVSMKLCVDSTTPTVPTALIDVDFKKLGNGLAIEITKTIPSVFDATVFAKQRGDAVPERFKKATPEITEKHVAAGTAAAPSLSSGDVAKSEQQKDAITKETSVTNRAVGGYPTLSGQTYDQSLDLVIPFTETIVADGTGGARADVTPLGTDIYGSAVALKKTINGDAVTDALQDYLAEFPGTTNLVLPDILESVEVIWNEGQGEGSFDSEWEGYASGESASLSGSEAGNAQGSASLMPELAIRIKQTWAKNIPTTRSFFFLPLPISIAHILAKVSAIASWPVFKPEAHTIVLHGMKVSVDAKAQGAASVHFTDTSTMWDRSEGSGTSEDVSSMVSAVNIPPTIHEFIELLDLDRTLDAVASATASWVGNNFPSINATANASKTASAFVYPESLAATAPSVIPSSGVYLIDSHVEIYGYGYGKVYAETLDASVLA